MIVVPFSLDLQLPRKGGGKKVFMEKKFSEKKKFSFYNFCKQYDFRDYIEVMIEVPKCEDGGTIIVG